MLNASNSQVKKRKKGSTTISVCLVVSIFGFLLSIAATIYKSSVTYSTTTHEKEQWQQNNKRIPLENTKPITCNRFDYYDLCHLTRPTILDPTTATLFAVDPTSSTPPLLERTRPYPRKFQDFVMALVRELTLTTAPPKTSCAVAHSTPALVFSAGGLTGNFYHDINDGFIPLFITVHSHFADRNVILAVVNCSDWWLLKYADLFPYFTRHPIINLDQETTTHCFPSAIVGLITHGAITVDPTLLPGPHPKTILDFYALLRTTYGHGNAITPILLQQRKVQPQLLLLNRTGNRRILNMDEVHRAVSDVGFSVVVFEPKIETPLREAYRLFEASHAMVGVHGAGLTQAFFLRPGAVFMQVVPIGLGWLANNCYKSIANRVGLDYIGYDIELHESSLAGKYASDSLELKDPEAFANGNWSKMKDTYLTQDVKIDILRFKRYLKKAYQKAKKFMIQERLSAERQAKTTTLTVESFEKNII